MTSDHLSLTQSEFVELLTASPKLRSLVLKEFDLREEPGIIPNPVALNKIEKLVLYSTIPEPLLQAYPLIACGSVTLSICLTIFSDPEFLRHTQTFLAQLKPTSLIIDGDWARDISAVLTPLPHLRVLAFHGCNLVGLPIQDLVHKYSVNHQSWYFWPAVHQMHIIKCIADPKHIQELLSIHTPRSLHIYFPGNSELAKWGEEEKHRELENTVSQTGVGVVWVPVPGWRYPDSWEFPGYLLEQASLE
ncbi:hypothetical protein FS749_005715 [Ceratobasidium sp. UAMH 11750]|nr:hypothetical protein FS749_005715 [Ceratobasidium sp. UAMH 11750]